MILEILKTKLLTGVEKMADNLSFYEWVRIERERLLTNAFPDFVENSYGETYVIECDGNVEEVRKLVKEVLFVFNNLYMEHKWINNVEQWKAILPHQFTKNFARELTAEEVEKERNWLYSLTYKQKLEEAKKAAYEPWRLSDWAETMHPQDRVWFWWGDTILGERTKDNYFVVAIKLLDDYYSFNPIKIFFKNCGAKNISFISQYDLY